MNQPNKDNTKLPPMKKKEIKKILKTERKHTLKFLNNYYSMEMELINAVELIEKQSKRIDEKDKLIEKIAGKNHSLIHKLEFLNNEIDKI